MANKKGDTKEIYRGVKAISGTKKPFVTKQPTLNKKGKRISDPEELANVWTEFLAEKFSPTKLESLRAELEELQGCAEPGSELNREEFDAAVKCMKNGKAAGKDGIPAEVWKNSQAAGETLFQFLRVVWDKEVVSPNLAVGIFVMIHKKDSQDDCANYRCIGLLNHAYKIMTVILLKRLMKECHEFFSDWQTGFRSGRGCRDNILLLRVLYDQVINGDGRCMVTYIDYKAAFDSVSHKFLDLTLARAKASRKSRAIFRAIYAVASGVAKVKGTNGKIIFSKAFDIGRGVVQGDIVSPIFFILALDQLFQEYDNKYAKGVRCGELLTIKTLGYADDAALAEDTVEDMTARFTNLADKSLSEADMLVRMDKTYSHHVCRGGKVQVTEEEIKKAHEKLEFQCDFCKRKFETKRGMHIHRASCIHQYTASEKRYEIEEIRDVFGSIDARWFLVKWVGYDAPEWQRGHLLEIDAKDAVRHFWTESGLSPCKDFYPDPDGQNRCTVCAKTYKRPQDLKAHRTRTKHYDDVQDKISPAAERRAMEAKKEEMQAKLPTVKWGDIPADNCWQFEYLGAIIQADGEQMPDVRRRVAMARQRHGKMRHVWESGKLHPRLKMRLYIAGVCSVMVYGSETWKLTTAVRRFLNGANSQMVAQITKRTIREEASAATRSYDLVASIRAKRLKWLGFILRMEDGRLVKMAVQQMYDNRKEGDLLMDAPETKT